MGQQLQGLLSLRYGIAQSANIVAVKTLTQISPQLGFDYLQNFGFSTMVDKRVEKDGTVVSDIGQPLALGGITDGVTNMELNAAYAAIANKGTYIKPKLYTKIVDHNGNVLIDNTAPESTQVIKETTAWLLTNAMVDVVTSGTGGSVNFGNMAIAGKTGTTSDYKDVWFSGFTPYYTATTWTGYDNNVSMKSSKEKNLSKTMWKAVMSRIHENLEYQSFPMAGGIVTASICSKSGRLPIAGVCDGCIKTEYFAEGTVPTEYCDVHYFSNVCLYSGLAASDECRLNRHPSLNRYRRGSRTTTSALHSRQHLTTRRRKPSSYAHITATSSRRQTHRRYSSSRCLRCSSVPLHRRSPRHRQNLYPTQINAQCTVPEKYIFSGTVHSIFEREVS